MNTLKQFFTVLAPIIYMLAVTVVSVIFSPWIAIGLLMIPGIVYLKNGPTR